MQISKFSITNYRSLVGFKVDKFDSTTIFFGENNAGKSNILSALQMIFARKVDYDEKTPEFSLPKNFSDGLIRNFSHNFFEHNESLKIDFSVSLSTAKKDFKVSPEIEPLAKNWPVELTLEGNVQKNDKQYGEKDCLAKFKITSVKLAGTEIYNSAAEGVFFPSLQKKDKSNFEALNSAFKDLMEPLNDCVDIIPSGRDMHPIRFHHDGKSVELTPATFKSFLHNLYLSETEYPIFEKINAAFSGDPYSFGQISFAYVNEHLEIMVKEKKIRLPIKSLGAGVLQILYIVSAVIYNQTKIVCVEEFEQNLSPNLQAKALRNIQSMIGTNLDQIVLSSHSSVFAEKKLSMAIHLIDKDENGKTVYAEEISAAFGPKAKKHFIPSAMSPELFDKDAYKNWQQEL